MPDGHWGGEPSTAGTPADAALLGLANGSPESHVRAMFRKGIRQNPAPRKPAGGADEPFWRLKRLDEMTAAEWESLCDGCARCCLLKLEDEDTGEIHFTDVGCTLLDAASCRCRDYLERGAKVPDCVRLTPEVVPTIAWLPSTCAYRLVAEGKDLYWWHPLVSGEPGTVHEAGISVRDRVSGPEETFTLEELIERVVDWPATTGADGE